jgi:uncharacterized membrane protein
MSRSMITLTLTVALGICSYATPFAQAEEKSTMDKANEATTGAYDATKEGTEKAWDATKEGTHHAWDATKEGTGKAWEATKEGTRELNDKIQGE